MTPHAKIPSWDRVDSKTPAHAKIVATLGPASDSPDMLDKLIEMGVSVFRLNFSHGTLEDMDTTFKNVREASARSGRSIAILGDLQGPKMRVGKVPDIDPKGGIILKTGDKILFKRDQGEAAIIDGVPTFSASFDPIYTDVLPGQRVLINDGAIRMLAVEHLHGEWLKCRVTVGGRITSSKGINLPESDISVPAITERDWECARWAVDRGVDYLALSFVRTAEEVRELIEKLEQWCTSCLPWAEEGMAMRTPVIVKIEKPQAVDNLDAIIEATDAVMVARGDLGVEMDVAKVPVIQKHILAKCNEQGKPCIVATQMLESMIDSPTPTRAEASDVANAVFDGCDAVMLSGETAVGAYPDIVVETMQRIIKVTEARMEEMAHAQGVPADLKEYPFRSAALARGVWHMAEGLDAKAVVVWSQAGGMARYLSQNNFRIPIYAYTSSPIGSRRMALFGGVTPILTNPPHKGRLRNWTDEVEDMLVARSVVEKDDKVLLVAGKPLGAILAQSTVAILRVGDQASGFRVADDVEMQTVSMPV
ncbi:MAG: pyruvate kinase [Phycisphaerales bacterium]